MTEDTTYWDYLQLEKLLALQQGTRKSEQDVNIDELHFIIVHQVFELWFKLAIEELRLARDIMARPQVEEENIPFVVHHLKRVNTILELAAKHFDLMETLTPQDFLQFRSDLGTASGFQSFQLREIEFILGLDQQQRDQQGHGDPSKYIMSSAGASDFGTRIKARMQQAMSEQSFRDAIHNWLYRTPIHGSMPSDEHDQQVVNQFIDHYLEQLQRVNEVQIQKLVDAGGDESKIRKQFQQTVDNAQEFLQAGGDTKLQRIRTSILFIESYRKLPLVAWPRMLIDTIVEMEEYMVEFRFQHARMVERIIGRRVGTGGSSGVDYLDQTTKYRVFPELWAVRTLLLPAAHVPPLQNEDFYKFTTEIQK